MRCAWGKWLLWLGWWLLLLDLRLIIEILVTSSPTTVRSSLTSIILPVTIGSGQVWIIPSLLWSPVLSFTPILPTLTLSLALTVSSSFSSILLTPPLLILGIAPLILLPLIVSITFSSVRIYWSIGPRVSSPPFTGALLRVGSIRSIVLCGRC